MSDEHIHVQIAPAYDATRDDRVDVHADVDVDVDTSLSPMGILGIVGLGIGAILILLASILFLTAFPQDWYATSSNFSSAKRTVELVLVGWGLGIILVFLGTSLYFYGRTVLGAGRIEQFRLQEPVEVTKDA